MNSEADCNFVSEKARKIGETVEERDTLITERDARIQYYTNSLENLKHDFKQLEKSKNDICEDQKLISVQIQQIVAIKECIEKSQKVIMQALLNQQIMEKNLKYKIEEQENKRSCLLQELAKNCAGIESQLKERNPLYLQLQVKKTECLKNKIAIKILERNIRQRKKINSEKIDMQKKLFYADCVKLAESYFIAQAEIKLDVLKHDKTKEIMKLHELQEQLKMKKKIGISYHSIQKIADGKTPTPQPLKIGSESKVSSEASKKIDSHFDELDKLFATSQNVTHSLPVPSDVHINPKIVITDEQILPPLPVTPSFAPVKRKRPVVDVYATWKKMNSSFSSQQSDRRSQPSQQSQKSESSQKSLSQVSQLSPRSQEKLDDCHSRKDEQAEASSKFREVSADDHPLLLNESGVENSSKDAYQRRDIVQVEEVGTNSENVTFDVPNGHVEPVTEDAQVLASSKNTANTPANEPQKSVRFNLDKPLNSTKETKSLFGGLSLFDTGTFSSFFKKPSIPQHLEGTNNQDQNEPPDASIFDSSSVFGNCTRLSVASDAYRSPEYEFDEDGETIDMAPFDARPMTTFGFSFGSKGLFK